MILSPRAGREAPLISERYRVLEKLGEGGIGAVYLVHDGVADRDVALKVIRPEHAGSLGLTQLQSEFQAIARLRHPQIARAHDFGYAGAGKHPYYTREYIEGAPLPGGPPPRGPGGAAEPFLRPLLDLLEALEYMHAQETLHRDVHAGNVIVARDERRGTVLIDFGLAHGALASLARRGRAASGIVRGSGRATPVAAPEVLRGEPHSPASDLYAAGRLLLFRLTGEYHGEPHLPSEIPGWSPRTILELERIIGKALLPDPRARFASAREMRSALEFALRARSRGAAPSEPTELTIGRDPELERLDACVNAAAEGRTSALWVHGAPGLGKSRLLTEARWRAQLRGVEVVEARFLAGAASAPTLSTLFASLPSPGDAPSAWLSPLAAAQGGSSRNRAEKAAEAFVAHPGSPLVLLLDDVEAADRESRLFAEALFAQCARRRGDPGGARGLAVVATAERAPPRSLAGAAREAGVALALRPLESRDSEALLRALVRPAEPPPEVFKRCVRVARGVPLRLRQIARALREARGASGEILEIEAVLEAALAPAAPVDLHSERPRRVLETLAILGRPVGPGVIAAVSDVAESDVRSALRSLARDEVACASRTGGRLSWAIASRTIRDAVCDWLSRREARRLHLRAAGHYRTIRATAQPSPRDLESLARHLLAAGRRVEGREAAVEAAGALAAGGLLDDAAGLLTAAAAGERSASWRLRLAEETSEVRARAGDHLEGVEALEPVFHELAATLSRRDAVRLRRRLGVHHHRAGDPETARRLFLEACDLAHRELDRRELVLVLCELAELYTFRGDFARAEASCRDGLDLLAGAPDEPPGFRTDMELTLRASLGHLELRRMALPRAREELEAALALTRPNGPPAMRALVLNNLGIVHNQLNRFDDAVACLREAETLLDACGERGALVQTACNLAVIAAKRGRRQEAEAEVERASHLLGENPGDRVEFFVTLSRGLTEFLLGDLNESVETFARALPLGRRLGDDHLVRFAELYVVEAHLVFGNYQEARRLLRSVLAFAAKKGPPLLERLALTRALVVEDLLGRPGARRRHLERLRARSRTSIELPELWNDLLLHLVPVAAEPGGARPLVEVVDAFRSLGIPSGERFARVGLLYAALADGDLSRARVLGLQIEREREREHPVLGIVELLACAEWALGSGQFERSMRLLQEAANALVGRPLLELDWRVELARAQASDRFGDRDTARHHVRRSLQAREFILRSVDQHSRAAFAAHDRFRPLEELRRRLLEGGAEPLGSAVADRRPEAGRLAEIIGSSEAIESVREAVARLCDLPFPVLIVGETGAGKEVVARAIHRSSSRAERAFESIHCASLPAELFESEIFGHEAGAFTGAEAARPGLVEHAEGGTLFLDEVTLLSVQTQGKLLQFLDSRTVRRLGGLDARAVDVRVVASSSRDPQDAVRRGELREDLYYRLRTFEVRIPPLRERRADIPLLLDHFLRLHARQLERPAPRLDDAARAVLTEHDWPGNVRELEGLVVRILVEGDGRTPVSPERLRAMLPPAPAKRPFPEAALEGRSLEELRTELERAYLEKLFRDAGGDIHVILERLRIQRSNLYSWFRRVGIDIRELRGKIDQDRG
jgi:DNA-binding NtrC family response regulator/Tfp pilus assembly protein PilF